MKQWFLIENEQDYKEAVKRFEEIREAEKGAPKNTRKCYSWLS